MKNILKQIFNSKLNVVILTIFLVIIIIGIINKLDFYPVLAVNNQIITERKINLNAQAGLTYYKNYLEFLNQNLILETTTTKMLSPDEVRVIILNQLIERVLIHQEIKKKLGKNLNNLIEEKISNYLKPQLEEAAKMIYNLNKNDFKNEILVPQAERDLLAGHLFLENKNIEEWLKESKKNASIKIFNQKFRWTGEKIELND